MLLNALFEADVTGHSTKYMHKKATHLCLESNLYA
jgi:hypothetical protein